MLADRLRRDHDVGTHAEVLNGIAYDGERKRIFLTGKLWSKMFEVKLVRPEKPVPLKRVKELCVPGRTIFRQPGEKIPKWRP